MKTFHYDMFGVYSPKGKLESVELTQDTAEHVGLNFSPRNTSGHPVMNRKVGPVTVFAGTHAEMIDYLFKSMGQEWEDIFIARVKTFIHEREAKRIPTRKVTNDQAPETST